MMAAAATDALALLRALNGDGPEVSRLRAESRLHHVVAGLLYNARQERGITQAQLAKRAKTSQPAIARQEDGDYAGHTLGTLARLFHELGYQLEVSLSPLPASRMPTVKEAPQSRAKQPRNGKPARAIAVKKAPAPAKRAKAPSAKAVPATRRAPSKRKPSSAR